jgi:pyruvate/2-oxoglutarate dehydrogenase complex dihydrolipoamide acyltransferase (E2) component
VGFLPEVVVGEPDPPRHRRRERRRTGAAPPVPAEAPQEYATGSPAAPVESSPRPEPAEAPAAKRKARPRRVDAERGLRGIVGDGPSQVGVVGAMRARDAARPTAEDLAEAERDVVVVRRHYVPPDTLPGSR